MILGVLGESDFNYFLLVLRELRWPAGLLHGHKGLESLLVHLGHPPCECAFVDTAVLGQIRRLDTSQHQVDECDAEEELAVPALGYYALPLFEQILLGVYDFLEYTIDQ